MLLHHTCSQVPVTLAARRAAIACRIRVCLLSDTPDCAIRGWQNACIISSKLPTHHSQIGFSRTPVGLHPSSHATWFLSYLAAAMPSFLQHYSSSSYCCNYCYNNNWPPSTPLTTLGACCALSMTPMLPTSPLQHHPLHYQLLSTLLHLHHLRPLLVSLCLLLLYAVSILLPSHSQHLCHLSTKAMPAAADTGA